MQRKFTSIQDGEHICVYVLCSYLSLTSCESSLRYRVLWGWKLSAPKHLLVHLLTNTFERLLARRRSVVLASYPCFILKLVSEVRWRPYLGFSVPASDLCGCTAFTCAGHRKCWCVPAGMDFFPSWSRMVSVCSDKGCNHTAPAVLAPVFFNDSIWHLLPSKCRIYT